MKQNQHQKRAAGFTLVEAIVAVGILGMVSFMVFKSLLSVMGATKMGAEAADQVQRERVAIKTVEVGLRGMVYYEQNQDMYALEQIPDQDYPYFSFVARVPPDFIGSREFNGQALRRLSFFVDDVDESRALVLEQRHVMRTPQGEDPVPVVRSILAPQLDQFMILFWSTSAEAWIDEWTETNSLPSRVKVEMALIRQDGGDVQLKDIHKREVVIHSVSVTKANQNPSLPSAVPQTSGSVRPQGSKKPRYTPEQIAEYRKKREEDARRRERENDGKRKLPEGSKRVSDYGRYEQTAKRYDTNGDGILDSGERAKWRADYAASRNSQSSGGSKVAGSGGTSSGGGGNTGAVGGGNTGAVGGGRSSGGGSSVLLEALILNDELTQFNAETLQDLVDAGLYDSMEHLQSTAPDGAEWGIDPDTGLVVPIYT